MILVVAILIVMVTLFWRIETALCPAGVVGRVNRRSLWVYRAAGVWLLLWLVVPVMAQVRTTQERLTMAETRLDTVDGRVRTVEEILKELRIDARLSVLEQIPDELASLRTQTWGILGGLVLIAAGQILQLRARDGRGARRHSES